MSQLGTGSLLSSTMPFLAIVQLQGGLRHVLEAHSEKRTTRRKILRQIESKIYERREQTHRPLPPRMNFYFGTIESEEPRVESVVTVGGHYSLQIIYIRL